MFFAGGSIFLLSLVCTMLWLSSLQRALLQNGADTPRCPNSSNAADILLYHPSSPTHSILTFRLLVDPNPSHRQPNACQQLFVVRGVADAEIFQASVKQLLTTAQRATTWQQVYIIMMNSVSVIKSIESHSQTHVVVHLMEPESQSLLLPGQLPASGTASMCRMAPSTDKDQPLRHILVWVYAA